ncbi:hypothetical protein FJZ19_00300 [Candidatus Pacearchaeota archaeon]|nr:hypothetical protein [Candidatus Pacearchaeota archaeon]
MIKDNTLFLRGPFSELEKKFGEVHSILRYFIYNYVLLCLEKKLKIYNIHASSVIDKKTNKVFMFVGHAGSGKTTCLLAAVEKGLMILGNDLSSIKEENKKYIIFPTSAFSPINNKTLSKFKKIKNITENVNKFYEKTPINLNIFKYRSKILNPKLTIIFPHIIEDSKVTILPCKNKRKAASEIYEQITNRIRNTSLLYYSLPIPSLDNEEQMNKRAEFVKNLIDSAETIIYVRGDAQKIIDKII